MYRISLYQGYFDRRRRARRRLARTAALAVLVGLELLLVGSLGLSAVLLGEQADRFRDEIARLRSEEVGTSPGDPALNSAREMLAVRAIRTDWSPALAALSRTLDPSLQLIRLVGQCGSGDHPARLEVVGTFRGSGGEMETVSGFMDALRNDRGMASAFPGVKLGGMEGGSAARFSVVCEAARSGS